MSAPDTSSRRNFLKASAAITGLGLTGPFGTATAGAPETEITWLPAWQIRELIAAKQVSPTEVTRHFMERIDALEPQLKAFTRIDHKSVETQVAAAEKAVLAGEPLGPLHGVPIALKSHILIEAYPTLELMAPEVRPAMHDDIAVERLRQAGAIIIGQTVMPGMGRSSIGSGGITDLADHVRNPWDLTRAPGSSSAGSVTATAAAMLPLTIGSDGGGSTRLPSALTGVIGFHPTVGRIPFVSYQTKEAKNVMVNSTIGPITRDVRDSATVMSILAGPDGRDFYCIPTSAPDYLSHLQAGVGTLKFAWTDDFGIGRSYALPETESVISAVRQAAQGFATLGAAVKPTDTVWEDIYEAMIVTNYVNGFGLQQPENAPSAEAVQNALTLRARNHERFRRLFANHDLLLSPTIQFTAFTVEDWDSAWTSSGQTYPGGSFAPSYTANTHMFNWLGFPAISVPVGFLDGLPIGMQIVGMPDREPLIMQAAYAFMKAFPRPERPEVAV